MTFPTLRHKSVRQLTQVISDGPGGYRTARKLETYFTGLGYASGWLATESRIDYVTRVVEDAQRQGQGALLLKAILQAENSDQVRASLQRRVGEILSPDGWTVCGAPEIGLMAQPLVILAAPLTPRRAGHACLSACLPDGRRYQAPARPLG
ncbi:hypothetical protein [Deinococcus radiotolerans]|uniref:Uncharacterized protein n=1 Tax=Deinococcus radiotolerans TaxID=1309407 RepID=A0ABQ2FEI3_9DEIO|nr:hypothetical protein [Deinococcus radiotolerans]GGK85608.1 hypothetical protein GCM10010844_00140 [Deinococcus radiotolerans]